MSPCSTMTLMGRRQSTSLSKIGWHCKHVDPYRLNQSTGIFVLLDASTCSTVAAGMIL